MTIGEAWPILLCLMVQIGRVDGEKNFVVRDERNLRLCMMVVKIRGWKDSGDV